MSGCFADSVQQITASFGAKQVVSTELLVVENCCLPRPKNYGHIERWAGTTTVELWAGQLDNELTVSAKICEVNGKCWFCENNVGPSPRATHLTLPHCFHFAIRRIRISYCRGEFTAVWFICLITSSLQVIIGQCCVLSLPSLPPDGQKCKASKNILTSNSGNVCQCFSVSFDQIQVYWEPFFSPSQCCWWSSERLSSVNRSGWPASGNLESTWFVKKQREHNSFCLSNVPLANRYPDKWVCLLSEGGLVW